MVLRLEVSRIELALAVLILICAFAAPLNSCLNLFVILCIEFVLFVYFVFLAFFFFHPTKRVWQIRFNGNSWGIQQGTQQLEVAAPVVCFFSEHLVIADFHLLTANSGRPYRLMIFSDSMNPADYRRFRRYLRFDNGAIE